LAIQNVRVITQIAPKVVRATFTGADTSRALTASFFYIDPTWSTANGDADLNFGLTTSDGILYIGMTSPSASSQCFILRGNATIGASLTQFVSDVSLVDFGNLLGSSDSTNGAFVWKIPEVPFTTSTCKIKDKGVVFTILNHGSRF
jgi:hypothetical protein